jgi:hypothetical protein
MTFVEVLGTPIPCCSSNEKDFFDLELGTAYGRVLKTETKAV